MSGMDASWSSNVASPDSKALSTRVTAYFLGRGNGTVAAVLSKDPPLSNLLPLLWPRVSPPNQRPVGAALWLSARNLRPVPYGERRGLKVSGVLTNDETVES